VTSSGVFGVVVIPTINELITVLPTSILLSCHPKAISESTFEILGSSDPILLLLRFDSLVWYLPTQAVSTFVTPAVRAKYVYNVYSFPFI